MRSVALTGRRGSGKTTIAHRLVFRGWRAMSWADPVRHIFAMAYGDDVLDPARYPDVKRQSFPVRLPDGTEGERTGRDLLQRIGTDAIRANVDEDFWVRAGLRIIDAAAVPFVNDDTRFPNEVEALRSRDFLIVWLDTPDHVRWERIGYDPLAETHPSETSVGPDHADIVVGARPSVDEMVGAIEAAAR